MSPTVVFVRNQVEAKKAGFIKMSRVERFILLVGAFEEKIFKKRSELRELKLRKLCAHAVSSLRLIF